MPCPKPYLFYLHVTGYQGPANHDRFMPTASFGLTALYWESSYFAIITI